ncbi:hypothetical protein WOLCODRAFT_55663, partial [Wolfiporia cocos MD-104 SS10]
WRTSTEEYKHLTLEQVVAVLGLPDGRISFLNEKEDPDGRNPWSKEGKVVLKAEMVRLFNPCWHQYVGVLKMMHSMLNGKLMLLIVRVGKTLQAIMFATLRVYYHEYYKQYNKFP